MGKYFKRLNKVIFTVLVKNKTTYLLSFIAYKPSQSVDTFTHKLFALKSLYIKASSMICIVFIYAAILFILVLYSIRE